ncbi:MAG: ADP-ribosylation/Crystallin J1 [Monoraphidium minutum]|nr:MAG: ADP-ribosylation/Crystallin J1 [Monoraphidium minutum]
MASAAAPAAAAAPKAGVEAVRARAKAAVLGGIVADAATMPLHWIYDVPKMNQLLADAGRSPAAPEFFPTPSCPFYNLETPGQGQPAAAVNHGLGDNSPYGEELFPLASTLAAGGAGGLDEGAYARAFVEFFEAGPSYRNASVRGVLAAWAEGKRGRDVGHPTDHQANCFAKVPLLVARYAGSPELMDKVEAAVRVQQNNDRAVLFGKAGAALLERVVLGASLEDALSWAAAGPPGVDAEAAALIQGALATRAAPLRELTFEPLPYMADMMKKHMDLKDELPPFTTAVWCNGPACGNPAAFANVAMAAAHFSQSYVDGVRANLMAGGDNCSRSCLIGALLAAANGLESIPADWAAQTKRYPEYERFADAITAHLQ